VHGGDADSVPRRKARGDCSSGFCGAGGRGTAGPANKARGNTHATALGFHDSDGDSYGVAGGVLRGFSASEYMGGASLCAAGGVGDCRAGALAGAEMDRAVRLRCCSDPISFG
jgi:hypothetical protein